MNWTNEEQSRHLVELGLSKETADMSWCYDYNSERFIIELVPYSKWIVPKYAGDPNNQYLPCWSVGALLEVMPVGSTIEKCKDGYSCYAVYYSPFKGNNQIEAAYNMVVWLLENNYIKQ